MYVSYSMPLEKYRSRRWEIYFPSEEFLEKWKARAKAARMPLSKWIFETVEAHMDEDMDTAQEMARDQETLREQNRSLRRELENAKGELERLTTEVFKLKNEALLQPVPRGVVQLNERIVNILKSGGTWSSQDLLKELDVNARDIEAIQITTKQLQMLQDFELVRESAKGWKWVG
jgi:FtsZ-binding cell division protein ZapB